MLAATSSGLCDAGVAASATHRTLVIESLPP
jgi:hypothetical protein